MAVGIGVVLFVGGFLGFNLLRDSGKAFFQRVRGAATNPNPPATPEIEKVAPVTESIPGWVNQDQLYAGYLPRDAE
jgi:hypothetical protein